MGHVIPRIIHYCWLSGDPYPELIEKCIGSWKAKLSDYRLVLWDRDKINSEFPMIKNFTNYDEFHEGNLWLGQTIECKKYAFAADYIRVYALYRYGGVYLDADVEITGSLDNFLTKRLFIGFDYQNDFEPAIIGAEAGHPWMKVLMEYYSVRPFIQKGGKPDIRPLPAIFEEMSGKLFRFNHDGSSKEIRELGIALYSCDYFSPKDIYFNKIRQTKNTVAIHHFDGSWLKKGMRYKVKRLVHQFTYIICGKIIHDKLIYTYRLAALRH